ncbi:MAG: bifunctional methylenetetrahydrofolate dehydrogenase/methenyltetrahydrofolate cyclohydrolase FolD [Gammaproteobacteria bacterium]|nr:bifunctional methylenetetrahydrofolate dehydrogenase/methenyltetrahydrofolate cyclohydrolase FolD [Gammaproteobacteria bacterium]
MGARIDGKMKAQAVRAAVAEEAAKLTAKGTVPGLAVVIVGSDPASQVYVRNKGKMAREAGFASFTHELVATVSEHELLELVRALNNDPAIHGILVQLPLPDHIDEQRVINTISPAKDVDGFHVQNVGRLVIGERGFVPCTPLGCMMLIKEQQPELAGLHAVVVGRSNIVGKPMASLLLRESCTVTVAHSRTRDLPELCRSADILVAAVGRPRMIGGDWIKPGAIVIDVGINRIETGEGKSRLVGDVDYEKALDVAAAITPVPGGVGPMTIACLLKNTLDAARQLAG